MNFGKQKNLIARTLNVSKKRIKLNLETPESRKTVKELLSREDARNLLEEQIVTKLSKTGNSRTRANKILSQKRKGRRAGHGSRKGTANARFKSKDKWILKIRALRKLIQNLKSQEQIDTKIARELYMKAKGNFFRNKRHMNLYIEQNNLLREYKQNDKE